MRAKTAKAVRKGDAEFRSPMNTSDIDRAAVGEGYARRVGELTIGADGLVRELHVRDAERRSTVSVIVVTAAAAVGERVLADRYDRRRVRVTVAAAADVNRELVAAVGTAVAGTYRASARASEATREGSGLRDHDLTAYRESGGSRELSRKENAAASHYGRRLVVFLTTTWQDTDC